MADAGQPADDDASTKGEASSAQEMLAPPAPGPSQTVRRLAVIAVILAIGGAAFGVAFTMLPDVQAITNPPAYNITTSIVTDSIFMGESFTFSQQADGTIIIQAQVFTTSTGSSSTGSSSAAPLVAGNQLSLFGTDLKVIQCPAPDNCVPAPNGTEMDITFPPLSPGDEPMPAVIQDPSFGFAENDETAEAILPYVYLNKPFTIVPFKLMVSYNIPDAGNYAWSMPPESLYPETRWEETINPPNTVTQAASTAEAAPATELIGTDNAAQNTDTQDIFISGALFGLVAAALLTAGQEVSHLIFHVE